MAHGQLTFTIVSYAARKPICTFDIIAVHNVRLCNGISILNAVDQSTQRAPELYICGHCAGHQSYAHLAIALGPVSRLALALITTH